LFETVCTSMATFAEPFTSPAPQFMMIMRMSSVHVDDCASLVCACCSCSESLVWVCSAPCRAVLSRKLTVLHWCVPLLWLQGVAATGACAGGALPFTATRYHTQPSSPTVLPFTLQPGLPFTGSCHDT
jgi:hypothetical protein